MHKMLEKASQERGQVLMLAAVMLTGLLGLLALVIDGAAYYVERRSAQNAADHAAQAAAYELIYGGSVADAQAAAWENAAGNGFDNDGITNTVTVSIPPISGEHIGDGSYAEVVIQRTPTTFFLQALTSAGDVQGRGVAAGIVGQDYAIFVGPDCDGSADQDGEGELEGDNAFIDGAVYAADLEVDGDSIDVTGPVTWLCDLDMDATNWSFGSGPTQLAAPPPSPVDPELLTYAHYEPFCTFTATGNMRIDDSTPQYWVNNDPNTDTLKPGVYCAPNGEIEIHAGGNRSVNGNVTFVSNDEIELHSDVDDFNLTAYLDGVLAFTTGAESGDDEGEIEFEGDNGEWIGMLLAPNGEIELEGGDLFSSSTLLYAGEELEIEGDLVNLTAMDLDYLDDVALVE